MPAPGYRTFYRIVLTDPPTERDMMSHAALGKKPRDDSPTVLRRWRGVSLFDTIDLARKQARGRPWLGNAFIASLDIPETLVHLEQTGRHGHYTAWEEASTLLQFVTGVHPV